MKKILKFNIYFILVICISSFSIISAKAIITDTFRVGSVESDKFSTTIRKVSEYNYVVSNANGGSITVTTSSGNLRCAFQNVTTNVSSMGNKCTIYGSIPSKKYEVKIFSENDNFSNPQYFKVLTIDVKNSDSSLSNVNLKSVTDNSGKKLETYINDYYHYTYTNDTSSINIVASSSSAKCEVTSTGITSGLVSNKNTCTIKKEGFKKGTYKIKITNGNSAKYYLIALTPTSGYSTSVSSVTAYGLGNIVRKIDDGEYNVLFKTGEIRVKAGDLGAYCNFTTTSSSLSKFSKDSECGLYAGIKTGSYPFTVTNGKESRNYKLNVVSSDSSMKDVSIKSLTVNSDETSTKDTDGHYTVKHNGKLYFKVTPNSSNATCRITDYYKTTNGIYQSGNTCYVNLEDAQSGNYYLEVINGDTTKFYIITYQLKSGATARMNPRKIVLNQSNNIYLNQGRSFEITAIVLPGNATNREVNWTTSDSTIASVTDNGMIYGEKPGIATITATSKLDSSIKKSVNVIINETTANVVKTDNGNSGNNDATLKSITSRSNWFKIDAFNPNTTVYTIDTDIGGGEILATATDSKATVKICDSDGTTGCVSGVGTASRVITGGLKEINTYLIIVTNGTATKTYTLNLRKDNKSSTPSSSDPSTSTPSSSAPSSSDPSSSTPSSSTPSSSTPGSNTPGTSSDNKTYLNEIFDINSDKVVNQTDYSIISYYYLQSPKILNAKNFSIYKAHFDVINPNGIDLINVKDVGFFILGSYSKISTYNSTTSSSSSSISSSSSSSISSSSSLFRS